MTVVAFEVAFLGDAKDILAMIAVLAAKFRLGRNRAKADWPTVEKELLLVKPKGGSIVFM